jgi:hypothetical protein
LPQVASAAEYYWKYETGSFGLQLNQTGVQFSSPSSACSKVEDLTRQGYPVILSKSSSSPVPAGSSYLFTCTVKGSNSQGTVSTTAQTTFRRYGDTCPPSTSFNPLTGNCEGDPCLPKKDQPQPVKKGGIKGDGWLTIIHSKTTNSNYYIYPPVACYQGCAVNIDSKLTCTVDTAHQYRCGGTGKYNGTTCSSQNPNTDPDPDGNAPEPEVKNEKDECVYGTVNGVTSCVKRNKSESEGVFGGPGTICAGQGCTGKDPKSKEDKIDTKITTSPNASGGIDTVKTDTKTVTTCVANATNCTTTTTVKTTTTKADANGNVTSTTGTCKGAQCADNTNPDADGDGFGDCSGDDCGEGEGEEKSEVAGEGCDVPLSCSGDAIQCAILRKEKESFCADEEFREVKEDELKQELDQFFAQEKFQPLDASADDSFDMSTMFDTSSTLGGGSCPTIQDLSFSYGEDINVPLQQLSDLICPYYVWMGYLMVAFAMWRAAEIVAKGL